MRTCQKELDPPPPHVEAVGSLNATPPLIVRSPAPLLFSFLFLFFELIYSSPHYHSLKLKTESFDSLGVILSSLTISINYVDYLDIYV